MLTRFQFGLLALAVLVCLPFWLLPIAPLTDWPVHLAMSKEMFTLWQGQAANPHYFLDFSFVGYSFVNALLLALQLLFPIELAGKLVLSLAILLCPISWQYFLGKLAPQKQMLSVMGLSVVFSIFFFYGGISQVFAFSFGLMWLGIGLSSQEFRVRDFSWFLLLGALTFLSHAYTFFLVAAVLGADLLYQLITNPKRGTKLRLGCLLLLGMVCGLDTISVLMPAPVDHQYSNQLLACTVSAQYLAQNATLAVTQSKLFLLTGAVARLDITQPLDTMYLFPVLKLMVLMVLFGYALNKIHRALFDETVIPIPETLQKIHLDRRLLALALLLWLHFMILDASTSIFNIRSAPFAWALLVASIQNQGWEKYAAGLIAVLILANVVFLTITYVGYQPEQSQILSRLTDIASRLPNGATVLVQPSAWNAPIPGSDSPLFESPHYHSMLLMQRPDLYVSGQFLNPPYTFLRTDMGIDDEMIYNGPYLDQKGYARNCYANISVPPKYAWILDGNMTLARNPDAG